MLESSAGRQLVLFFFNDTATTEIYTLSLHDALPICELPDSLDGIEFRTVRRQEVQAKAGPLWVAPSAMRSEEHTSELQSPLNLVCRLLLEKKKAWKPDWRTRFISSRPPLSAQ